MEKKEGRRRKKEEGREGRREKNEEKEERRWEKEEENSSNEKGAINSIFLFTVVVVSRFDSPTCSHGSQLCFPLLLLLVFHVLEYVA